MMMMMIAIKRHITEWALIDFTPVHLYHNFPDFVSTTNLMDCYPPVVDFFWSWYCNDSIWYYSAYNRLLLILLIKHDILNKYLTLMNASSYCFPCLHCCCSHICWKRNQIYEWYSNIDYMPRAYVYQPTQFTTISCITATMYVLLYED